MYSGVARIWRWGSKAVGGGAELPEAEALMHSA